MALETVMSVQPRMINDLGVTRVQLSERVRIKNRLNRIRDFTGQDLLASFKKLELKQLLSTIMKIKLYPDLSNQNSRFIQFDDFFLKKF